MYEELHLYRMLESMIKQARKDVRKETTPAHDAYSAQVFLLWVERDLRWYLEDIETLERVRKGEK